MRDYVKPEAEAEVSEWNRRKCFEEVKLWQKGGREKKIRNVFEEKKQRRESVKLRSVLFCFDLFCLAGSNIGRLLF